jgi:hypothetical protein
MRDAFAVLFVICGFVVVMLRTAGGGLRELEEVKPYACFGMQFWQWTDTARMCGLGRLCGVAQNCEQANLNESGATPGLMGVWFVVTRHQSLHIFEALAVPHSEVSLHSGCMANGVQQLVPKYGLVRVLWKAAKGEEVRTVWCAAESTCPQVNSLPCRHPCLTPQAATVTAHTIAPQWGSPANTKRIECQVDG